MHPCLNRDEAEASMYTVESSNPTKGTSSSAFHSHQTTVPFEGQEDNRNYFGSNQLTQVPGSILKRTRPLSSQVGIDPITSTTLPSYRRLITLLLPIRYPDNFYKESIADTSETSLARIAVWHDQSASSVPLQTAPAISKVVGGIQCRLEDVPSTPPGERQLYIQTIAVLSPFRQLGIATHLLDTIIDAVVAHYERVTNIYAHVWEANQEALEWYERRGFIVQGEVVQDYYRRLKPSGARVVRRRIGVEDHLAVRRG